MRNRQLASQHPPKGGSHSSPSLVVELKSLRDLKPDPSNPRLHTDKQVGQLVKSITAFGFCVPLLLDQGGHVIAGHGRLLAAQRLGWTELPTITLDHLSPDQVRALRLADNRLAENSAWNDQLLAEQLRLLAEAELDFDLEAIGFDLAEIDLRVQSLGELDDEPEALAIVGDVPVVTRLGDVWQLGRHRIACGDSLKEETFGALLGGERVAMVFADVPYNLKVSTISGNGAIQHPEFAMASGEMSRSEFITFLTDALARMKHTSIQGALIYACIDWRHLGEMCAAGDANQLELKNVVVWSKGTGGMGSMYRSQHEEIFVFKSGSAPHTNNVQLGRYGRNRTNLWEYPGINSFARNTSEGNLLACHPTVKPVALVADAMLDASERGDAVLDPFLGSGTTVIAAEKTGRIGYGIELDPRYVDTAIRRWQLLTGEHATHALSGQHFDDAAATACAAAGHTADAGEQRGQGA